MNAAAAAATARSAGPSSIPSGSRRRRGRGSPETARWALGLGEIEWSHESSSSSSSQREGTFLAERRVLEPRGRLANRAKAVEQSPHPRLPHRASLAERRAPSLGVAEAIFGKGREGGSAIGGSGGDLLLGRGTAGGMEVGFRLANVC
ncbi:hypothetical protein ZWY2020_024402 [Hordeum vulgare]|nr:hypothetical protein ZWY2020_024402 [Hordeum vulgare]